VLDHQLVPVPVAHLTQPGELTINGRLCTPQGQTPKTVMLALHGITYNSEYWDPGYHPDTYSFARKAMDSGYAVFAIDRLGYGKSARPLGPLVTLDAQAEVTHQLIGQLREGRIGGDAFPRVALVGHSYGTITAWRESAEYNDADAVIGTGYGPNIQAVPLARFFSGFQPAILDPKTAPLVGLDATYLTGEPGGREQDFLYDLSNVEPGMLDYDQNVLRDTVTAGEGATFINRFSELPLGQHWPTTSDEIKVPLPTGIVQNIKIPSFLANGEHDLFFCGANGADCNSSQAVQRAAAEHFSPEACIRGAAIPHAGHDLNLQRNAGFTFDTIIAWADEVLGPDGTKRDGYAAGCGSFSGENGTDGPGVFGAIPANRN